MTHTPAILGVSIIVELSRDARRVDVVSIATSLREKAQRAFTELSFFPVKRSEDVVARETKFLQSSLSPFLTTPLRSDAAEVTRILGEALQRTIREGSAPASRAISLRCGLLAAPSDLGEQLRPLADEGLEFLERAFSRRFDAQAMLFETTATFDTVFNPALIGEILREATRSTAEAAASREALGSVVVAAESSSQGLPLDSSLESVVTVPLPSADRHLMLPRLASAIEKLREEGGMLSTTVWSLFFSYSPDELIQVRTMWSDQAQMESGVLKISALLRQSDSGSGKVGPRSVWFRKVSA